MKVITRGCIQNDLYVKRYKLNNELYCMQSSEPWERGCLELTKNLEKQSLLIEKQKYIKINPRTIVMMNVKLNS